MKLEKTAKQIQTQVDCLKRAGMFDATVLGFGGLIGYCREPQMVNFNDDDLDLIIFENMVTREQEEAYMIYCEEEGLFRYRKRTQRHPVTGRLFWISMRMFPRSQSWKCCHWFMWRHKGIIWHCKGVDALIKGIPADLFEPGLTVPYLGTEIKIPKSPGACLDFWYPNWVTPRDGGKSSFQLLMKCPNWKEKDTWTIEKRLTKA